MKVVPIFKKGKLESWSMFVNYWSITLLGLPRKVCFMLLERWILELYVQAVQCGIYPGHGTVDQMFTHAQHLEGSWEFDHAICMNVWHWRRLTIGLQGDTYRVYCRSVLHPLSLYNQTESCFHILHTKSSIFSVDAGLLQACRSSPVCDLNKERSVLECK